MRTTRAVMALVPVALIAAACGAPRMSEDVRADLARVSGTTSLDLASTQQPGLRVVSAIESPAASAPRRAPAPTAQPNTPAAAPALEIAPAVSTPTLAAPAGLPAPTTLKPEAVTVAQAPPVMASPRPRPNTPAYPAGGVGEGDYGGTSRGPVVVIRGGGSVYDPCAVHGPGGSPPILVNNRIPVGRTSGGRPPVFGR